MKKNLTLALALILVFLSSFSSPVSAAAERSILLIDASGSVTNVENILKNIDKSSYDGVYYFTHENPKVDKPAKGDSHICQNFDSVAKAGFKKIDIVTDGQQYPGVFTSLSVYTDLNITIFLTETMDKDSEKLVNELKTRLLNSNLKVVIPDGTLLILLDDYSGETDESTSVETSAEESVEESIDASAEESVESTSVETSAEQSVESTEVSTEASTEAPVESAEESTAESTDTSEASTVLKDGKNFWILIIILILLVIICLIIKNRKTTADCKFILIDASGSTSLESFRKIIDGIKNKRGRRYFIFNHSVREVKYKELKHLVPSGKTHGCEALAEVMDKGARDLTFISDGYFNGESFDSSKFTKKFTKVKIIVPSTGHCVETVENLRKIADNVEVVTL